MINSATFVNAVMEVRVEQGVLHFVLGEMVPGKSGKPDFIPAFRAVIPADNAEDLFSFLISKVHVPQETQIPTLAENSDKMSEATKLKSDGAVTRKKIIARSALSDTEKNS